MEVAQKQFEFLPEIWEVIKQYFGLNGGINIKLPKTLAKLSIDKLQTNLYLAFRYNNVEIDCFIDFVGSAAIKRKNMMKLFYKNFDKISNHLETTNHLVGLIEQDIKFSTPEDLEIGECVYLDEAKKIGRVISKTKSQFVVSVRGRVISESIKVRNNKFIRYKDMPHLFGAVVVRV